jgi:hypothetical protein
MRILLVFIISSFFTFVQAQSNQERLIQYSGNTLVSMGDSIDPVAFVTIKNKSRKSGAYSGPDGFFTLVVKRGDTVEFSSVGFKKSILIVPEEIQRDRFFATQVMIRDTNILQAVTIVPWRNVEELRRAVIDLKVNEDDLIIAYQNMQYEKWENIRQSMEPSRDELRRGLIDERLRQNSGLLPPNNLANPFTWMNFIDYLGKKKKKKSNTDINSKY